MVISCTCFKGAETIQEFGVVSSEMIGDRDFRKLVMNQLQLLKGAHERSSAF